MSIIAYVGLPGSGKSYDTVANQIMPALENDRRVVTNIPLNRDEVRKITRKGEIVELPLDVIAQQPEKIDEYATPGCVLIIDECWRLWPAGLKANRVPQPFKSMLAEHRHRVDSQGRAMQIVLCTQDLAQLAAFARQLVEQTFHHTKLTHMGSRSSYRIDVFHGAVTGAVPPVANRIREIFGKYKPQIFKLYQSHTMSDSHKSGADESGMDGRANVWRKPIIWVGLVGALAAFVFGATQLMGIVDRHTGEADPAVESVANEPTGTAEPKVRTFAQPVSQPVSQFRDVAPSLAQRENLAPWKLEGVVVAEDGHVTALVTDGRRRRLVYPESCRDRGGLDYVCTWRGVTFDYYGIVPETTAGARSSGRDAAPPRRIAPQAVDTGGRRR